MPNFELFQLPSDDGGVTAKVGLGKKVNVSDLVAGYEYVRGSGVYTAKLEGSIGGQIWIDITTLAANGSGEIPAYYNMARINVSVGGAAGTSRLGYHGKS